MKKLMTMLAAAAMAFGLYAADTGFLSGAGFDTVQTEDPADGFYTWKNISGVGTFTEGYWSNSAAVAVTNDVYTFTARCGQPVQFADLGPDNDQYANVKTTLGQPVSMRVKPGQGVQQIDEGLYFDAMVKPTVFDEIPNMAAYDEEEGAKAKIGVFVYQSDETDETTKKLYVYAGETATSATNFYLTGQAINDTKWYRLTVKMIANINKAKATAQPGYVVFIDGAPVSSDLAKIADETNLTPEAKEWNKTGSLFLGLTKDTTVSEVLVDGQGSIDSVAFTTAAPDFAESKKFCQIKGAANIASFTVGTQTWTADSDPLDVEVAASIEVTNIEADDEYFCPYTTTNITGAVKGQTYEVGEAKKLGATVEIGGEKMYFETAAAALAELNDTEKYATATDAALTLNDDSDALTLDNANITLTLDLAGKTMAATNPEADAVVWVVAGTLTIINSTDEVGTVDGTSCYAAVDMDDGASAYITAGQFKGDVYTSGEGITGGWFTEEFEDDSIIADGYVAKALPAEADPFKWKVVEDTGVDFTVTAGANSSIKEVLVNEIDVTDKIPTELNAGDTYKVTFEAEDGYVFAAGVQTVFEGTAADAAITVTGPDAVLVVATVTDADGAAMGSYGTFADAITAATNGCTVTLQKNATTGILKENIASKGLTFDLNNYELTIDPGESKYAIQMKNGYNFTFKNGKIKVAENEYTTLTTLFQNYANLTVEDVDIDATNLKGKNQYWDCAAVFAVMNGNVQITGSTSVTGTDGYVLSIGNHAGTDYLSRAVTLNTTGTLAGNFLFAGGAVTNTAATFSDGARFDYGSACTKTNNLGECASGTCFAISDLEGFERNVGAGIAPVYPSGYPIEATYKLCGQLYADVATAEAAAAGTDKSIVLFENYELTANEEFNNAVAVVAPAKITLGTYKLTAPNGDLADEAFVIPTSKKVKKTDNMGSFTYELEDAAVPPINPGHSSDPYETQAEAEAAAAKTPIRPADGFGLTGEALSKWQSLFVNQVYKDGNEKYRFAPVMNADGTNAVAQAEAKLTKAINVGEIAAATGAIETMVLEGAEPGFYYTLFKSADVTTVLNVGSHDKSNSDKKALADGKVTFENVTKPSDAAGFFSVKAFDHESFTAE